MQPDSLKGILIQPTYIELLKYAMCWAGFMDKKGKAVFSLSRKKNQKITVQCKSAMRGINSGHRKHTAGTDNSP